MWLHARSRRAAVQRRAAVPAEPAERGFARASAPRAHAARGHSVRTSRCASTPSRLDDEQERLDAHVGRRVTRADGVVGVQRREHEVAGERRLHRDLRGLEVADLADHDDVRVLAQDRAQGAREGQLDPRVDLRLADAVERRTRSGPRPS